VAVKIRRAWRVARWVLVGVVVGAGVVLFTLWLKDDTQMAAAVESSAATVGAALTAVAAIASAQAARSSSAAARMAEMATALHSKPRISVNFSGETGAPAEIHLSVGAMMHVALEWIGEDGLTRRAEVDGALLELPLEGTRVLSQTNIQAQPVTISSVSCRSLVVVCSDGAYRWRTTKTAGPGGVMDGRNYSQFSPFEYLGTV